MSEQIAESKEAGGTTEGVVTDAKPWLTSVPTDLRGHDVFKEIDKPEGVYQKLIELSEKSKSMVQIPGENATEQQIADYRKSIGVPETIDKYSIEKPEVPEGLFYDEAYVKEFVNVLFEEGIPLKQAQKIHDTLTKNTFKTQQAFIEWDKKRKADNVSVLEKEWGADFKKKNAETHEVLSRFIVKADVPKGFGGVDGFKKWVGDFATDPMFNWLINSMFTMIGNDSFVPSGRGPDNLDKKVFSTYKNMN